jgi:hypothetical protein
MMVLPYSANEKWGIRRLRVGDIIVASLLIVGSLVWIAMGIVPHEAGSVAVVEVSGKKVAELKLNHENYITIRGKLGAVLIGIDGSGIRILESKCPNKLCKKMGAVNKAGEWIACIPNELVIRIEGDSGVDAISPSSMIP